MLKVHTVIVRDTGFGSHLVKLGTQVGLGCGVLMGLGGEACQDFPSTQLDDPLLGFSVHFYLCEQLMIYLCYCLAFVLCHVAVDGDKTVRLRPVLIHSSLQIDHHLDKLSS